MPAVDGTGKSMPKEVSREASVAKDAGSGAAPKLEGPNARK